MPLRKVTLTTREEKYEYESAVATRLFQLIGLLYTSMTDPWKTHGGETGADVEIHDDGRRIGIQVTEFSADEGAVPPNRGLRAATARDAAQGELHSGWIPLRQQVPALVLRIREKVALAKRYNFEQFDEVWLLVATFVPWAPVPTFQLPNVTITPEDLNRHLNNELRQSNFTRAFVYSMLSHTVYEWSSVTGWRCIHESPAAPASTNDELWFNRYLTDPEIRKDPKGWAFREAERVLNELRGVNKDRGQA
jgi:hypothetical protein